ncbi:chromate efflux transporter [Pyxidicoccus sp. 3LFB2]
MTSDTSASPDTAGTLEPRPPHESYGRLFLRFLTFGALAWGGPVAQIGMLKAELVERERWISVARFNRALAVYQVLPGPEAHELCVYFGMVARGRWGGVLAGLGFMLPGFVLMLGLSWVYVRFGTGSPWVQAAFAAVQAAVAALIVRAIHRIGEHALLNPWLWAIGLGAFGAQLLGAHFVPTLAAAGGVHALVQRGHRAWAAVLGVASAVLLAGSVFLLPGDTATGAASGALLGGVTLAGLFLSGLKAGLLTFGGAYTAIPFVRRDAVQQGAWMTDAQFLDGLALGGVLPAPLIIFSTFVGFLGGGWTGAVLMTAGVFLPAFAFTLVAHDPLERLVERRGVHAFLEGVTAGVVGLIAATTVTLLRASLTGVASVAVFAVALALLYRWKSRYAIPAIVLGAAVVGLLLFQGVRS